MLYSFIVACEFCRENDSPMTCMGHPGLPTLCPASVRSTSRAGVIDFDCPGVLLPRRVPLPLDGAAPGMFLLLPSGQAVLERSPAFVSAFLPAPSALVLATYWVFCHGCHHKYPLGVPRFLRLLTKARMVSLPCICQSRTRNFPMNPQEKNKTELNECIADTPTLAQ